ncbi:hypothetical protein RHECNPAF_4310068 [Rhizobium etli CNPAF512]|nr:hypothetical protein RHECNPAF_4310068 [Rhizobium etli CNPAF512]
MATTRRRSGAAAWPRTIDGTPNRTSVRCARRDSNLSFVSAHVVRLHGN